MIKPNKLVLLFLCGSVIGLAGCDNAKHDSDSSDSSSSVPGPDSGSSTPSEDSSSTPPIDRSSALERAFKKNYSNFTAYVGAIGTQGAYGDSEVAWYDYHVNGYDVIYDVSGDEAMWAYFHDYEGKNYRYFEEDSSEPGSPAWLNSVYDGVSCTLSHSYWSLDAFLNNVEAADFTYMSGYYVFSNANKFDNVVNTAFESFYETELLDLVLQLDANGYISVIKAFGEDAETDLVDIELYDFATSAAPSSATIPEAPNANNVKEYWQYKGWSGPQVHVYPKTINLVPDASAAKEGDAYVLEIEKDLHFAYEIVYDVPEGVEEARQIKESTVKFVSTNDKVATIGVDANYKRVVKAVAAGDCEFYVEGTAEAGKEAVKSNSIKVHVNGLAEIDMTDAVYNITFDANSDLGVAPAASNSLNSALPFDIQVNKGVNVITAPENSTLFGNKKTLLMRTGLQNTMNETFQDENTAADAVAVFDFDDQQVSGIAFYYGAVYGNSYKPDMVTKIAIEAKNPSQTWDEAQVIDITADVKENLSTENFHLVQKQFLPASQVRIVMRSSVIGDSMEMGMDNLIFASNDQCKQHYIADQNPVTSVTISENSGATAVRMGKTLSFSAGVLPNNATSKAVVWKVSDDEVASISEDGVLTPKKVGTVTVTASSYHGVTADPVVSNEIVITVKEAAAVPAAMKGTWIEDDIYGLNTFVFTDNKVSIEFSNGDKVELTLDDINDSNYCVFGNYVDKNTAGYLLAKPSSSYSGKVDYSYNIVVGENTHTANIYSSSSTLAKKAETFTLSVTKSEIKVGAKTALSAKFGPSGCYEEDWDVVSSDDSIVKINNDDGVKEAVGVAAGKATLTATSSSGLKSTIEITVVEPQKVSSITVNLSASSVTKGSSVTATAIVAPTDAENKAVTWSTSNEEVATVNSKGVVTTIGVGTVDIIATAADGSGVTGKATLTVTEPTSTFDGTYTATDTTGNGASLTVKISDSGNSCEIDATDSYGSGTLAGTLEKKSSSGNIYVYEGELKDSSNDYVDVVVTIDFDKMTITIDCDDFDNAFMFDYSEFQNATITKA